MSDGKFGIGIVGCGNISDTHANSIKETKMGQLVAAHSRTQSRLDEFCKTHDATGYTDLDDFLGHPGLDIVVICTPSGTHLNIGKAAAEAGKHIIVEKPIEVNMKKAHALIDSCNSNGVKYAVIYQNRFIDDVVAMKNAIDRGVIGDIFMVDVSVKWFRDQDYYDKGGWRGTLKLDGGGAVINQAIHTVDLMLWFAGDLESISAYTGTLTHENIEGEDNAVAAMQFKSGAMGTFCASTSIVPPGERSVAIHGEKGTALLEGDKFRILKPEGGLIDDNEGEGGAGASSPLAGMTTINHRKQYDQILDALKNGKEPVVSGDECLRSLRVVEALYTSARLNKRVFPDDI